MASRYALVACEKYSACMLPLLELGPVFLSVYTDVDSDLLEACVVFPKQSRMYCWFEDDESDITVTLISGRTNDVVSLDMGAKSDGLQ